MGTISCSEILGSGELVEYLRDGNEDAFDCLVEQYHDSMLRLARSFAESDESLAREIVQETWLGVIDGIDRFEGRSSIKTWIFSILSNQAKKHLRERSRQNNWSSLFEETRIGETVSADADRFDPSGEWVKPPSSWESNPERRVEKSEILGVVEEAIDDLPERQRAVVVLRDVEGVSSDEACDILDITDGNQRVLLHRGRVRIREAIEQYYERR